MSYQLTYHTNDGEEHTITIAHPIASGVIVLADKDGELADLLAAVEKDSRHAYHRLPSSAEYRNSVADFLYHVLWTAKKLGRGELLTAKDCLDIYMKNLLLKVPDILRKLMSSLETLPLMKVEEIQDPRSQMVGNQGRRGLLQTACKRI